MSRVQGKVALITGGARGQGAAESKLLAMEGASVIITDILDDKGKDLESEICKLGGIAEYLHLDVTDEDEWRQVVLYVLDNYKRIDVLVNNAGILLTKPLEDTTGDEWDKVMRINSKGVFLGTREVIPIMREVGGGSIINISSAAGIASRGDLSAYSASKGAVRLLTKSTAIQYATDGIRCNSVHPGLIVTDMTQEALEAEGADDFWDDRIPMSRLGTVDDIAKGVLFLASDESSYMTGSELIIDGGITAK